MSIRKGNVSIGVLKSFGSSVKTETRKFTLN